MKAGCFEITLELCYNKGEGQGMGRQAGAQAGGREVGVGGKVGGWPGGLARAWVGSKRVGAWAENGWVAGQEGRETTARQWAALHALAAAARGEQQCARPPLA